MTDEHHTSGLAGPEEKVQVVTALEESNLFAAGNKFLSKKVKKPRKTKQVTLVEIAVAAGEEPVMKTKARPTKEELDKNKEEREKKK